MYIQTIYELYLPDLYADKIRNGATAEEICGEFRNKVEGIIPNDRIYQDIVKMTIEIAGESLNRVLDEEGKETISWDER